MQTGQVYLQTGACLGVAARQQVLPTGLPPCCTAQKSWLRGMPKAPFQGSLECTGVTKPWLSTAALPLAWSELLHLSSSSTLHMFYTKSLFELSSKQIQPVQGLLCLQQPRSCSHQGTSAREGKAIVFLAAWLPESSLLLPGTSPPCSLKLSELFRWPAVVFLTCLMLRAL